MGRMIRWGVPGLFLLLACGKNLDNPVSPPVKTFTVQGKALYSSLSPARETTIHITVEGSENAIATDANGQFTFFGLTEGKYILKAEKKGYIICPDSLEVTIPDEKNKMQNFIVLSTAEYSNIILNKIRRVYGRITEAGGTPVVRATVTIFGGGSPNTMTDNNGNFSFDVYSGDSILIVPKKEGYSYSFTPDSLFMVTDCNALLAEFTARNEGAPLHSISGHILMKDLSAGHLIRISLLENGVFCNGPTIDSSGGYNIPGVKDGSYILHFQSYYFEFDRNDVPVILNGEDNAAPEIRGTYTGPTSYQVYGRVVKGDGIGIPGVIVDMEYTVAYGLKMSLVTDSSGSFLFHMATSPGTTDHYIVKPGMNGYVVSPENYDLYLTGIEEIHNGVDVTIPDFVASPSP